MEKTKSSKLLSYVLFVIIFIILSLIFSLVFFKTQFDNFGEGIERMEKWKVEYKKDNPNASDEEVDKKLDENLNSLSEWMKTYKKENPGSTDEDAKKAWENAWSVK